MSLLKRMLQEVPTPDACASICSGLHTSLWEWIACVYQHLQMSPCRRARSKTLQVSMGSSSAVVECMEHLRFGDCMVRVLELNIKYVCTTGYHWQFLQLHMFIQSVQCTARTKMISNLPSPVQDRFGFPDSENSGWYLLEHMRPSSSKSVCQDVVEIIVKQSSISM